MRLCFRRSSNIELNSIKTTNELGLQSLMVKLNLCLFRCGRVISDLISNSYQWHSKQRPMQFRIFMNSHHWHGACDASTTHNVNERNNLFSRVPIHQHHQYHKYLCRKKIARFFHVKEIKQLTICNFFFELVIICWQIEKLSSTVHKLFFFFDESNTLPHLFR